MSIITLTDASFTEKIENTKGVALVDFWAPWCMPCRLVGPVIEQLAESYEGKVTVGKLDVDENSDVAMKFHITGIPTVGVFRDGKLVNTIVGTRPEKTYRQAIESALHPADSDATNKTGEKGKQTVTVFSTPTCPWCSRLKSYLRQNNVAFKDIDVSEDEAMAMRMYERSGQLGVPQAWINGEVIVGFDQRRIRDLLGLPA